MTRSSEFSMSLEESQEKGRSEIRGRGDPSIPPPSKRRICPIPVLDDLILDDLGTTTTSSTKTQQINQSKATTQSIPPNEVKEKEDWEYDDVGDPNLFLVKREV